MLLTTRIKEHSQRLTGSMSDLSCFIEELELIDPPLHVGSFTWFKDQR